MDHQEITFRCNTSLVDSYPHRNHHLKTAIQYLKAYKAIWGGDDLRILSWYFVAKMLEHRCSAVARRLLHNHEMWKVSAIFLYKS